MIKSQAHVLSYLPIIGTRREALVLQWQINHKWKYTLFSWISIPSSSAFEPIGLRPMKP